MNNFLNFNDSHVILANPTTAASSDFNQFAQFVFVADLAHLPKSLFSTQNRLNKKTDLMIQ
jgi:hypothetical protein